MPPSQPQRTPYLGEEEASQVTVEMFQDVGVVCGVHTAGGGRDTLSEVMDEDTLVERLEALSPLASQQYRRKAGPNAAVPKAKVRRPVYVHAMRAGPAATTEIEHNHNDPNRTGDLRWRCGSGARLRA